MTASNVFFAINHSLQQLNDSFWTFLQIFTGVVNFIDRSWFTESAIKMESRLSLLQLSSAASSDHICMLYWSKAIKKHLSSQKFEYGLKPPLKIKRFSFKSKAVKSRAVEGKNQTKFDENLSVNLDSDNNVPIVMNFLWGVIFLIVL
jgi:hypothetical protein